MKENIVVKDLVRLFKKSFYIIILSVIVLGVAGFFWSKYTYHPVYTNESSFVVYHQNVKKRESDLDFMPTYEKILTNRMILQKVHKQMKSVKGYTGTVKSINNDLKVSTEPSTLIITVKGQGESAKLATALTNNTIKAFKKNVNKIVSAGTVHQLAKAKVKQASKSTANTKKMMLLGSLIGLAVGIVIVLFTGRRELNH